MINCMPRSPLEKKKKDFLKLLWRDEGGENPLITVSFVEPATICHLSLLKLLHIQFFFQYFVSCKITCFRKIAIASGLSGLANLEIGHQVPHLIRIYTKKESLKFFFSFIRNISRPPNSLVHACLIWIFDQGKSLFSDGLFLKMLEFWY